MTNDRALQASPDAHLTTGQILAGLNTVRSVLAPDLNDEELRLFAMVANRSGLDPFAKQIFAVKRTSKGSARVTFQTGIDGYRSIAARTGLYDGQDEPEYGPILDQPYPHPESATVRVYRKGVGRAIAATAYWAEYVPTDDFMWKKMPRVMIAKVAEALALRKAFPYDPENRQGIGADIYTADEMAQAERPAPEPVVRVSLAEVARAKAAEAVLEGAGPREVMAVVSEVMDEPGAAPAGCPARSPWGDESEPCVLPAGHKGNHRTEGRESWT